MMNKGRLRNFSEKNKNMKATIRKARTATATADGQIKRESLLHFAAATAHDK